MTRETLIQDTMVRLSKLPNEKLKEVSDFAEFLLSKLDNEMFNEGILKVVTTSKSYDFLDDDDDLYTVNDIIEKY